MNWKCNSLLTHILLYLPIGCHGGKLEVALGKLGGLVGITYHVWVSSWVRDRFTMVSGSVG